MTLAARHRTKALALVCMLAACSKGDGVAQDLGADAAMSAGSCTDPATPEVLTTGQDRLQGLVVDGTYAYWVIPPAQGNSGGSVRRIALAGGCPENLLVDQPNLTLQVADGKLYAHDGKSLVVVTAGTRSVLYASAGNSPIPPSELGVDGSAVYFTMAMTGELFRAARDGSGVTTLATGLKTPLGLALDDTSVYVANDGDAGGATPYGNGAFARVPKAGGAVESLVTVTGGQDVAQAGGHVYFLQFGFPPTNTPGAIWKLDLPGSAPAQLVTPTGPGFRIETDGVSAFVSGYVTPMQNGLYQVHADGTHASLASAAADPIEFALGADVLVYARDGALHKIAKP